PARREALSRGLRPAPVGRARQGAPAPGRDPPMTPLPVRPAQALDVQPPEQRWLIEDLWAAEAVGIVGGEPKCGKSFLALDVAVAVASGAPCLRRFRPARTGRVLLFAAEDALHVVRARLVGIAQAAGVAFDTLDMAIEPRAAPSRDGLVVELRAQGDALALHLVDGGLGADRVLAPPPALGERIEHALAEAATPLTRRALRRRCRIRASTLGPVLARLLADGRVTRSPAGYSLVPS